ncbi:serine/threonine protein kinase [Vibrio navarrensis]
MSVDKNEDKGQQANGDKTQLIKRSNSNDDAINENSEKKQSVKSKEDVDSQKSDKVIISNTVSDKTEIKNISVNISKDNTESRSHSQNNPMANSTLPAGHVVKSRYVIEALIGHGGLCDVYRAKDKVLESSGASNPYVALKVLQNEYVDQPETARMLIREAQHTQTLSHPNIIRVFDFGVDNRTYFIVMEYLDGETVEQLIQRSRPSGLPLQKAKVIFNQILDALIYAHSVDIVHADLKPANIMIESTGRVKILDFGVSKTERIKQDQYSAKRKTDDHAVVGYTPNYASINILAGNKPKREDDLFAFACIAYELVSCKHPYNRTTADLALKQALSLTKPPSLPWYAWRPLKEILSLSTRQSSMSASELKRRLNQTLTPKLTVAALILLTFSITVSMFKHYENQHATLESVAAEQAKEMSHLRDLLDTPFDQVLPLLNSGELPPVVRAGLLRYHQNALLGDFERQIDEILNASNSEYPDYDKVESVLKNAAIYYPDSHRLELLNLDIKSSKRSTLLSIERQINSGLERAQYVAEDGEKSLINLYDDLNSIHTGYPFVPSSLASEVFGDHLKRALNQRDAIALQTLITIGNTFFASFEEHKQRLAASNSMKDAIEQMSAYLVARENGEELDYPQDAARVLYKNDFDGLYLRLEKASTINNLDRLVVEIDKLASELPANFNDIAELRFQTANKYLQFSDILLKKRQANNARSAMKKANELLQQIDRGNLKS